MANTSKTAPRDSAGRFKKRRSKGQKGQRAASPQSGMSARGPKKSRGHDAGALAVLSLAILLGAIGFVFPLVWIGSLILMAMLWGSLAAERRRLHTDTGVLGDVIGVVADEAKALKESASSQPEDYRG